MALYKLHDFDSNYRDSFDGDDIKGLDVYTTLTDEKIGTVSDALVDDEGRFRYLIVDTGFWVFGKKVLLPIGQARIDYNSHRVFTQVSKDQVENLPNINDLEKIDYEHEEQSYNVYQPMASTSGSTLTNEAASYTANDAITGSSASGVAAANTPITGNVNRDRYDYNRHPNLYETNERDHQRLRLYEERLIANKQRVKTGEVAVGKHVETETARVAVPIEKERVVIERVPGSSEPIPAGADAFSGNQEVARMEVYEEVPDIHKEAFVREEVEVRKVVNQETAKAEEEIRREQLDLDKGGNPRINDRA